MRAMKQQEPRDAPLTVIAGGIAAGLIVMAMAADPPAAFQAKSARPAHSTATSSPTFSASPAPIAPTAKSE